MGKMIEELQEGISRLSAENTRLEELNREMVEVLKKLDFVEVISHDGDWITFCPACESYSNEHNKGCRLQSLLAKAEDGMSK